MTYGFVDRTPAVVDRLPAEELYRAHERSIFEQTDRLFAGLDGRPVARGHRGRVLDFAANVGGLDQPDASARLGRALPGRTDHAAAGHAGAHAAGPRGDAVRHLHLPGADVDAADSLHRRPHRDPLPRLRVARVPLVLSRLARARARRPSSWPPITSSAASTGRSRCSASSPRATGAGWSTPAGCSSRTRSSSAPACAARRRCGTSPSGRPRCTPARNATAASSSAPKASSSPTRRPSRLLECNSAFLSMLGYEADDMHGLTLHDVDAGKREDVDRLMREPLASTRR